MVQVVAIRPRGRQGPNLSCITNNTVADVLAMQGSKPPAAIILA